VCRRTGRGRARPRSTIQPGALLQLRGPRDRDDQLLSQRVGHFTATVTAGADVSVQRPDFSLRPCQSRERPPEPGGHESSHRQHHRRRSERLECITGDHQCCSGSPSVYRRADRGTTRDHPRPARLGRSIHRGTGHDQLTLGDVTLNTQFPVIGQASIPCTVSTTPAPLFASTTISTLSAAPNRLPELDDLRLVATTSWFAAASPARPRGSGRGRPSPGRSSGSAVRCGLPAPAGPIGDRLLRACGC
jgi:hypothetical protein